MSCNSSPSSSSPPSLVLRQRAVGSSKKGGKVDVAATGGGNGDGGDVSTPEMAAHAHDVASLSIKGFRRHSQLPRAGCLPPSARHSLPPNAQAAIAKVVAMEPIVAIAAELSEALARSSATSENELREISAHGVAATSENEFGGPTSSTRLERTFAGGLGARVKPDSHREVEMDGVLADGDTDRHEGGKVDAEKLQSYAVDRFTGVEFAGVGDLFDEMTRVVDDAVGSAVGDEVEVERSFDGRPDGEVVDEDIDTLRGFVVCPEGDGNESEGCYQTGTDGGSGSGGVGGDAMSRGGGKGSGGCC